jgi:ketosteroid isomerase-like protein
MMGRIGLLLAGLVVVGIVPAGATRGTQNGGTLTPQQAVDELLAADRAFSKAAAQKDVIGALSAMFARDVLMPVPGNRFARGVDDALAALKANPDNATGRVEWTPIRGGVSADGQHGFTFGFMTLRRANGTTVPIKYLAYWIKQQDGWRVIGYKRRPAAEGAVSRDLLAPALPARMVSVATDAAAVERHRKSLDAAERAFSDEAQKIGIGPAFAKYGRADAVNMGPPTEAGFVIGSEAIGSSVAEGSPATGSPVSWSPDSVLVASSGDLGITFGMIRANALGADGKERQPVPFFTVWWRAGPDQPWRYIAE